MMRQTYQLEWASKDLGQETRIALGDVNGDGRINIVAGTTAATSGNSNLYVFRFENNTYHQLARINLGNEDVRCIKVYDIDGDGRDEIIVGSYGGIFIYKMRGKELIKIAESTAMDGEVVSLAIADIDGDGKLEIVAAARGRSKIYIFRFDGKLVFLRPEVFRYNVYCLDAGDTDGDGTVEVVIKTRSHGGSVVYVLCFKDGKKMEKWSGNIPDADKDFIVVDDFDGDGRDEIIFDCTDRTVKILHFKGGIYGIMWGCPDLDQDPKDVAVFDVDGDGQRELVIVCLNTVYIYGWKGRSIVLEWKQTIPNGVICVEVGELNQRGLGEICLGTVYGYIYVMEARRDMQRGKLWVGKIQAIVQDTVDIPAGKPDAERGVEARAAFTVDEVKVLCDKVIVDGEVTAKILYVAALPSQPVHFFEATFPFLQFVHLYGAEPGMEALVFFKVEHINVDVVSPRRVKVTILFEMLVKLVEPCWCDDP
ncbi:FG-GAP-like repeat-containing protein [Biomaibacter acetigenes]|nr:FG-GAP-like repeat-containing protein [Biomaibacter acetigenes]